MKPRKDRPSILLATAGVVAASCSTGTGDDRSDSPTGESVPVERARLAGSNIIGYPNPLGPSRGTTVAYSSLLFDTLLWKDANGVSQPWLATKYDVSADGKTWRFTLHDGVTWQDGKPFTAEDVVFTWNYMATGPGKVSGGYGNLPVKSVVTESPSVVTFTTDPVYAPFPDRVASRLFVLPKHVWEGVSEPAKYRDPHALTGTGAYRLESMDETAGTYPFVSNESYFLGPPHVTRVEFAPAPNELLALGNPGVLEPDNSPFLAKDTATYPYDVAEAKAVLDQVGMKDVNGDDGVRELPDGRAFRPELLTNPTWNAKTAEAVKEYLPAAGVDVAIKGFLSKEVSITGKKPAGNS